MEQISALSLLVASRWAATDWLCWPVLCAGQCRECAGQSCVRATCWAALVNVSECVFASNGLLRARRFAWLGLAAGKTGKTG